MYQTNYKIAGISISVTAPTELQDDHAFSIYRTDEREEGQHYDIHLRADTSVSLNETYVSAAEKECVFRNELNLVAAQKPPLHLFKMPGAERYSAWDYLEDKPVTVLHYAPEAENYFARSTGVFNAAGFERILYRFGKFLYHCSYVDYRGKAVLFSAPSGGGKTTQGKLWERYADAEMINGDRAVLEHKDGGIICHGLPIAGSSGVFTDRSLPLAAVFTLQKADNNSVVRLKGKEAVYAIFSQLTVNMWNSEFVQDALDFSIYAASRVPIYRLSCNISQEAVELAEKEIAEGRI